MVCYTENYKKIDNYCAAYWVLVLVHLLLPFHQFQLLLAHCRSASAVLGYLEKKNKKDKHRKVSYSSTHHKMSRVWCFMHITLRRLAQQQQIVSIAWNQSSCDIVPAYH